MKGQNFCLTCKTTHSGDCPPHKVRTTGSDGLAESLRLACEEIKTLRQITQRPTKKAVWRKKPPEGRVYALILVAGYQEPFIGQWDPKAGAWAFYDRDLHDHTRRGVVWHPLPYHPSFDPRTHVFVDKKEFEKVMDERDEAREQLRIVSLVDRGWIKFEKELPEHGLSILVWMPQYMFTAHVVMGDDGQLEVMVNHDLCWPLKDYKKHHCTHWRTIMPPIKED